MIPPSPKPVGEFLVSWCVEPIQPLGVTSGLNTNSNQSFSYCAHKSFNIKNTIFLQHNYFKQPPNWGKRPLSSINNWNYVRRSNETGLVTPLLPTSVGGRGGGGKKRSNEIDLLTLPSPNSVGRRHAVLTSDKLRRWYQFLRSVCWVAVQRVLACLVFSCRNSHCQVRQRLSARITRRHNFIFNKYKYS